MRALMRAALKIAFTVAACAAPDAAAPPSWIHKCKRDLRDPKSLDFQQAAASAITAAHYDEYISCHSAYPYFEEFRLYLLFAKSGKLIDTYADPPTTPSRCFRFRSPDVDVSPPHDRYCYALFLEGSLAPREHLPESRD